MSAIAYQVQKMNKMLRLGVLYVSTAETATQDLLVTKNGWKKLRFCIDFRAVDDSKHWGDASTPRFSTTKFFLV